MNMIQLDGASGEGGGQILRTALSLAMITGQAFRIDNIRAKRPKPGLMRQHLVAVQAAQQLSNAEIGAAAVGARTLEFVPQKVQGGDYRFAIGSAGSCTLVLQTLLPALLFADRSSTVCISGGTHNAMAPPAEFLQRAYGRALAQMGVTLDLQLKRCGFYPAGGGEIVARIEPCAKLAQLHLLQRGERQDGYAESLIAGVPGRVAQRELEVLGLGMGWDASRLRIRGLPDNQGPGNVALVTLDYEHVSQVFCAFGEKSLRSELVARKVLDQVRVYLKSGAAVDEYLSDQLMLPMALAGGGSFTTGKISQHALTNASVLERFLPVKVHFSEQDGHALCQIKSLGTA